MREFKSVFKCPNCFTRYHKCAIGISMAYCEICQLFTDVRSVKLYYASEEMKNVTTNHKPFSRCLPIS